METNLTIKNRIANLYIATVSQIRMSPFTMKEMAEDFLPEYALDLLEDADIAYEHKTLEELANILKGWLKAA